MLQSIPDLTNWNLVGRPAGTGKEGPYISIGRALKHRRETMPGLEYRERSQTAMADRLGINQSYLSRIESGRENLANYDLSWFERVAPIYGWTTEQMLSELGIKLVKGSKLSHTQKMAQIEALEDTKDQAAPSVRVPYLTAGFGPAFDQEEPAGEILIEQELLDRYPNLVVQRVDGKCMEPDYPEGWFAIIIPDPALAGFGSDVLVWFAGNGRAVKRLLESREDGDHVLWQRHPNPGQGQIILAPPGSQILGVVVDIRRGGRPKVSKRELYDAIASEMPQLLENGDT